MRQKLVPVISFRCDKHTESACFQQVHTVKKQIKVSCRKRVLSLDQVQYVFVSFDSQRRHRQKKYQKPRAFRKEGPKRAFDSADSKDSRNHRCDPGTSDEEQDRYQEQADPVQRAECQTKQKCQFRYQDLPEGCFSVSPKNVPAAGKSGGGYPRSCDPAGKKQKDQKYGHRFLPVPDASREYPFAHLFDAPKIEPVRHPRSARDPSASAHIDQSVSFPSIAPVKSIMRKRHSAESPPAYKPLTGSIADAALPEANPARRTTGTAATP
ncbi:MAG: hypothetical protein IJM21_03375 [Clostridia bacterium]|nr:hypothetical protein [Clostridia bacterium]